VQLLVRVVITVEDVPTPAVLVAVEHAQMIVLHAGGLVVEAVLALKPGAF